MKKKKENDDLLQKKMIVNGKDVIIVHLTLKERFILKQDTVVRKKAFFSNCLYV
jgi:hypothetical protein